MVGSLGAGCPAIWTSVLRIVLEASTPSSGKIVLVPEAFASWMGISASVSVTDSESVGSPTPGFYKSDPRSLVCFLSLIFNLLGSQISCNIQAKIRSIVFRQPTRQRVSRKCHTPAESS